MYVGKYLPYLSFARLQSIRQKIAVKSNLLYDLTTTFNIGGEIKCDDTHTLNLSVNYNPWNFGGNKKMKHFMLQPEYRKWFDGVFMGSYIGFQLHYALFNFGGMLPWGFGNGKMLGIENRQIANNRYQAIWRASASPMVING